MGGLRRYLELTIKSKIGLSSGVIVWALVAVAGAAATAFFLIFAVFIWLAERYDPLAAALILCGFFLLLAILAAVLSLISHRRTVERAKLALAARRKTLWYDPNFLATGLQIGRALGWQKLVPLIAVGLLAAGLAKEWFGHDQPGDKDESDEGGED